MILLYIFFLAAACWFSFIAARTRMLSPTPSTVFAIFSWPLGITGGLGLCLTALPMTHPLSMAGVAAGGIFLAWAFIALFARAGKNCSSRRFDFSGFKF